jgi:sugar-specific transcriptional regulator TrmB
MNSDIIKKALLELGCSELEILIYQTLIDHNFGVSELANKFSVHRTKIYSSLESLESIGLVAKKTDYSRVIEVISPIHILSLLKIKTAKTNSITNQFSEVLPDILSGFSDNRLNSRINHTTGESAFFGSFDKQLGDLYSEVLCFISPAYLYNSLDISFLKFWIKKRISKNIKVRLLVPIDQKYIYESDDELQPDNEKLREIKYFRINNKFHGTFSINGSGVYFFNPILMETFVINDKITADTMKSIFELVWDSN